MKSKQGTHGKTGSRNFPGQRRGPWYEIRDDETCCFAPGRRFYKREFVISLLLGIWPHGLVVMDPQHTRYVVHQALKALIRSDGLILKAVRLPSGSITLRVRRYRL